jgi:diacylglycerol kinase
MKNQNFWQSLRHALNGIGIFFRKESNAQLQLGAAIIATALGFAFRVAAGEWIALLLCFALVLGFEMLNTAIEQLCNCFTKDFHAGIGRVKDIAAGAVLLISFIAAIVGGIIFIPKIIYWIKQII